MPDAPSDPSLTVHILGLGADGDGIAEGPDGRLYVPRALPGERHVPGLGSPTSPRPWAIVGPPSPERRPAPLCPHFPACGGCAVQHMSDDLYGRWKAGLLTTVLANAGIAATPEPMLRAPLRSRRRAAFSARWTPDGIALGFHAAASSDIVAMHDCAVLSPAIVDALPVLARIAAVVAPRPTGEARLSVLAAREGLDVAVSGGRRTVGPAAAELASLLRTGPVVRLGWNGEPIVERARPTVHMSGVAVVPPQAAFLQACAETEAAMAALVAEALPRRAKRAADLFAGLGTFTFALAPRVQVEAFDGDRRLIAGLEDAARNAQRLKPIAARVRDLFRDPLSPRELDRFDVVVLDPPRAGAKAQAQALAASRVARVVAVSCNPATLARDIAILVAGGYRLERLIPVDQFLFSPHLEAVAVLSR